MTMFLLTAPADAEAKRNGKKKTVAIFPFLADGSPNAATINATSGLLLKASAFLEQVTVLSGKKLRKKLKKDPKKAIQKCGANMKCLAKLGKKVKASEVLLVKVSESPGGGVSMFFVFIDVKKKTLARKQKIEIASAGDGKIVMGSGV